MEHFRKVAASVADAAENDPHGPFAQVLSENAVDELRRFASAIGDVDSFLCNCVLEPAGVVASPDPISDVKTRDTLAPVIEQRRTRLSRAD
jgi:hypothetical protein